MAIFLLLLVQCAFASLAIVGKVTMAAVPWPALMLLRSIGAALVFVATGALRGEALLPPPEARKRMFLLGFLGVFANQGFFLAGLRRTTSINASVLVATIPLFTVVFAMLTGREPYRAKVALGMALALTGLFLVVRPENFSFATEHLTGDLMVVANSASYGLYLALARDSILRYGASQVVRWVFLAGALLSLPVGAPSLVAVAPAMTTRVALATGYILLVPTAFAYAANAYALARVPASVVGVFIYLQPVIATVLALTLSQSLARWLGVRVAVETLSARTLVGGLVVLVGVFVATWKGRAKT